MESPDGPEAVKIHASLDEALALAFPAATAWRTEDWLPSAALRKEMERALGWRLDEEVYQVHRAEAAGRLQGHALVVNQLGLYKPITFLVAVDAEGLVTRVVLMVYRESRGEAVKRRRFLRQYEGKSLDDPIRLNRDIDGVTGATVSVRGVNAGVRKALALLAAYRNRDPR